MNNHPKIKLAPRIGAPFYFGVTKGIVCPFRRSAYDIEPALFQKLLTDEAELMKFATRYLRQVLFGENSIAEKPDAIEKRKKRREEIMAKQRGQMQKDMEKEIDSPE